MPGIIDLGKNEEGNYRTERKTQLHVTFVLLGDEYARENCLLNERFKHVCGLLAKRIRSRLLSLILVN